MKKIIFYIFAFLLGGLTTFYFTQDKNYNSYEKTINTQYDFIKKHDFPYPYKSMFAFCSDTHYTTPEYFKEYQNFFNSNNYIEKLDRMSMGFEVSDSFLVDTGEEISISLRNTPELIKEYYDNGIIDSIHTYGDFSSTNVALNNSMLTREYFESAWNLINEVGIKPKIWINHGDTDNVQNFGGYSLFSSRTYQQGDNPKSPYYHTDLCLENGIKYVWDSKNSKTVSEDFPLYEITLRDGNKIWGFRRYNINKTLTNTDWVWSPFRLSDQLSYENIEQIYQNGEFAIFAQHFGTEYMFRYEKNIEMLYNLKKYYDEEKILVSGTADLLDFALAQKFVHYNVEVDDVITINLLSIKDPVMGEEIATIENMRGVGFAIDTDKEVKLLICGQEVQDIIYEKTDEQVNISIKW